MSVPSLRHAGPADLDALPALDAQLDPDDAPQERERLAPTGSPLLEHGMGRDAGGR